MGFRENLKSELEYQDMKTKELAEKSGVNKRTIDHYLMSNPQEPSVTNALKIAQALNVSVEYLVTGIDGYSTKNEETLKAILCDLVQLSKSQLDVVRPMIHSLVRKI